MSMKQESSSQRSFSDLVSDSRDAFQLMYRQTADHAVKIKNHPWPTGIGVTTDGTYLFTTPTGATRDLYLKSVVATLKQASATEAGMDISIVLFTEHIQSPPAGILSGQLSAIIEDRSGMAIKTVSSYRYTDEAGWTFGDSQGARTEPIIFEKI